MRSIKNIVLASLVLAAPVLVSLDASAGDKNVGTTAGGILHSTLSLSNALLGISLGGHGSVDVNACAGLDLSAAVSCEVCGNADVNVSCDPVNLGLAAYAECAADCDIGASLGCKASCNVDCALDCALDLSLEADVYCAASCAADAEASCAAKAANGECDEAECQIAAYASCQAECDVTAHLSVLLGCSAKCGAACGAKCKANANLDCQVDCQAGLCASLEAECEADLNANAALFCDGNFIAVADLDACLNLLASLNVTVLKD